MRSLIIVAALARLAAGAEGTLDHQWCERRSPKSCKGRLQTFSQVPTSEGLFEKALAQLVWKDGFSEVWSQYAASAAWFDHNGDGRADLLLLWLAQLGYYNYTIRYFESVGGTTAQNATHEERIGEANPFRAIVIHAVFPKIAAVNWDGAGPVELVVSQVNHSLQFWSVGTSGQYEQRFGKANPFDSIRTPGPGQTYVQFADWNDDGHVDLLLSINSEDCVRYFERQADGSLVEAPSETRPFSGVVAYCKKFGAPPSGIRIVDWDGDGDLDLVVSRVAEDVTETWTSLYGLAYFERLMDRSLRLRSVRDAQDPSVDDPFHGLRLEAPFAGDHFDFSLVDLGHSGTGLPDLVYWGVDPIIMKRNSSFALVDRTISEFPDFRPPQLESMPELLQHLHWDAGDVDGDGDADFIVLDSNRSGLLYFENVGASFLLREGTSNPFDQLISTPVLQKCRLMPTPCNLTQPRVVDWNHDGHADLVLSVNLSSGTVLEFFQNVGGVFQYHSRIADEAMTYPQCVFEVVDVDGDGLSDLIIGPASSVRYELAWGWGPSWLDLRYFRRNSDGGGAEEINGTGNPFHLTFSSYSDASVFSISASRSSAGRLDLVLGMSGPPYGEGDVVMLYSRVGAGHFSEMSSWHIQPHRRQVSPSFAKLVDLNGDGDKEVLDLVFTITDLDEDGLSIPPQRGNPVFSVLSVGTCVSQGACNGGGFCDATTRQCMCSASHQKADCSACSQGYWTVSKDFAGLMRGRTCKACPGVESARGSVCSSRGWCLDDDFAQNSTGSLLAVGSGSCNCSNDVFNGISCGNGSCLAGSYESVRLNSSVHICASCAGGRYSHSPGSRECDECLQGRWSSDDGATACYPCYVGWSTSGPGAGDGRKACRMDLGVFILDAFLLVGIVLLNPVLQLVSAANLRIDDVTVQGSGVVVKTARRHRILRRPLQPVQVWLRGTGHRNAEDREEPFHVQVLDSERFRLIEPSSNQPATVEIESSIGVVEMRSPLGRGVIFVPAAIVLAGLVGVNACIAACLIISVDSGRRRNAFLVVLVLVVLGGLVGAIWVRASEWVAAETPLSGSVKVFRSMLPAAPVKCERGPSRAVTVQQLLNLFEAFENRIRSRNMYYMNENVIKPLTKPHEVSYAELVGSQTLTWFVSHFWGMPFRHFLESVRSHAEHVAPSAWFTQAYWVCTFCINQWSVRSEVGDGRLEDSSFFLALHSESCRGTCMVLDERVEPLRRSWCLFETLQSIILRERPHFEGFVFCTSAGVLNYGAHAYDVAISIAKEVAAIRVENAQASKPEDKVMIDKLVMEYGGFEWVNRFLGDNVKDALHAVRASFEDDFNSLNTVLGTGPPTAVEPKGGEPQRPRRKCRVDSAKSPNIDLESQCVWCGWASGASPFGVGD